MSSPVSTLASDLVVDRADDAERARQIRIAVRASTAELRERYPILAHQNAIGAGILAFAALGVVGGAVAYATHLIPWWVAVLAGAFFMSLSQEVQHDLNHRMYFSDNAVGDDVMMATTWLLVPFLSPWLRRTTHKIHHETGGTELDVEEILITLGGRWGPLRLMRLVDPLAAFIFLPRDTQRRLLGVLRSQLASAKDLPTRRHRVAARLKLSFPLPMLGMAVWYWFLAVSVVRLIDPSRASSLPLAGVVTFLAVVWLAPNLLRATCQHGIASNMHYFGDIEPGNVMQEAQVLNPWWLLPVQLFAFDFGATHAIHHFVPNDPFYLRHMVRKDAHRAMRANGVRFNDLGSFRRANRLNAA